MIVYPWTTSPGHRRAIEEHARSLIGKSISGVAYLLPGTSEESKWASATTFDVADMGVELRMSDASAIAFVWLMEGVLEGLGLIVGEPIELPRGGPAKRLNCTQSPEWQARLGEITTVGLSWHHPEEAAPPTVWSWRLGLANGKSVTIVLGEWRQDTGALTYQPDNVIVIFREDVASQYRIPASDQSAWGCEV